MRFTGLQLDHGSGVAIRELRGDAGALSLEEFEGRHGSAYLLLTAADLSVPGGPESTEVRFAEDDASSGDSTASLSLIAYPLRHSGRSPGHLITIGRARNSDVVIPDASISRFHAFVREGDGSVWKLLDAGSTNGTTVNGANVPQQNVGEAVELKTGDNVRFGQVELTFLNTRALLAFISRLER